MPDVKAVGVSMFDRYSTPDGVRYQILSYLPENDIQWVVSNLNQDWHYLADTTLNHPQFTYTFKQYCEKMIKLSSTTSFCVKCPWSHLWTSRTSTYTFDSNSDQRTFLLLEVPYLSYNPFSPKSRRLHTRQFRKSYEYESKPFRRLTLTFALHSFISPATAQTQQTSQTDLESENSPNTQMLAIGSSAPRIQDHEVPLLFKDEHHHVMPECVYNKISALQSDSVISVTKQLQAIQNDPKRRDRLGRGLIDIKTVFVEKTNFWLWSGLENARRGLYKFHDPNTWLCGLIDFAALHLHFPQWQQMCTRTHLDNINNFNDTNRTYQIPVLLDITDLCYDRMFQSEFFMKNYINIWRFGSNRFFTRIWVLPHENTFRLRDCSVDSRAGGYNDDMLAMSLNSLLATPALHVIKGPQGLECSYEAILWKAALPRGRGLERYVVEMPGHGTRDFHELSARHGTICMKDYNGKWEEIVLVRYDTNRRGHLCTMVFADATMPPCDIYLNLKGAHLYFYDKEMIYDRPVINFDLESLYLQEFGVENGRELSGKSGDAGWRGMTAMCGPEWKAFLIDVKPKSIRLFDSVWDDAWSAERMRRQVWRNEAYQQLWPWGTCHIILSEEDFDAREWMVGVWLCRKEQAASVSSFGDFLCQKRGQIVVWIDITREFDRFQKNVLKQEWLAWNLQRNARDRKELNREWNNRKYCINSHTIRWNKETNQVFYGYWVHLDDTQQVAPFGTRVKRDSHHK